MTKQEIIDGCTNMVMLTESEVALNEELSQAQLTAITDALAVNVLETVNPNGPCYPSTPR